MKIGILSMQRIFNYGSFLQAYGLKKILESMDCEVEFVDYKPGECLITSMEGHGVMRKIKKVLEIFNYDAPLTEKIRFIKYKKNYAKNYYPYLGIDSNMNYSPDIDVLVIGSDEVFNCVQDNTNVGYTPQLFGVGTKADKVISYAASFGNTTIEKLKKYKIADEVASWLSKFNAISVRDFNSGKIIKELIGKEPEYNLDPVLMYDFIGECKDIPKEVKEDKYMILYGYSGRFEKKECLAIKKYAKKRGLKVFCIGGVQGCCDKFIDCNPFEVIAYFQHAECVVTDTFHGTILSVITHRPFLSLIRSHGYGNSEKLIDLMTRLHILDRKLDKLDDLEVKMANIIDYDKIDNILKEERIHTQKYLQENIF